VKLLLDEMISPKIARELRGRGGELDVQAIKGDRPDLEAAADREIVRRIAAEGRALVTNDVLDFQVIHNQMLTAGEDHYGLIFTSDSTMPRSRASIPLWVGVLEKVFTEYPGNDALKNRVRHLP
jgi:predicted nuclease of predicted toxin-antitoxin system